MINEHSIIGSKNNHFYILSHYKGGRKHRNCLYFLVFDKDQNPIAEKIIPETKGLKVKAAFMNDKTIDLLLLKEDSKEQILYHARFDVNTLDPIGDRKELYHPKLDKKDKCYFFIKSSQDKSWISMIHIIVKENENEFYSTVSLYDEAIEKIWTKSYAIGTLDDIFITNDAEIVTVGRYTDKKKPETTLVFHVISEDDENNYTEDVEVDNMQSASILNVVNGKIICAGLLNTPNKKDACGYYAFSFNTTKRELENFDSKHLSSLEHACLLNTKVSKSSSSKEVSFMSFYGNCATDNGGVIAFHRKYYIVGNKYVSFQSEGILTFSVDTTGTIVWNTGIRKANMESQMMEHLGTGMFHRNGKTYFLFNEHIKNTNSLTGNDPIKWLQIAPMLSDDASLVLVSLDNEGNLKKEILDKETKKYLTYSFTQIDEGKYAFILNRKSKSNIAILEF